MTNGDGNLEISGCGDDVVRNQAAGSILAALCGDGGGGGSDIVSDGDDPALAQPQFLLV